MTREMYDNEQCPASSWRGSASTPYGPGNYNRCTLPDDEEHTRHVDGWGQTFELGPTFRVIPR